MVTRDLFGAGAGWARHRDDKLTASTAATAFLRNANLVCMGQLLLWPRMLGSQPSIHAFNSDDIPSMLSSGWLSAFIDSDLLCALLKDLKLGVATRVVEEVSIDPLWFTKI